MTKGTDVQFGIVLTGAAMADRSPAQQFDDAITLTHAARQNGCSYLVVGQHFIGHPYQYLQPIPLLSRLSVDSGEMRLATGILLLSLLHPVDVAEQLATLDTICGGRLVVGVGIGYRQEEFEAFDVERSSRAERMLECLSVVRRLWAGETVDHDGRFFTLHGVRTGIAPAQPGGPPVWLAGMRHRTVSRATELGYLPFIGPRASLEQVHRWVAEHRDATGNPAATLPLRRDIFVAERAERAGDQAAQYLGPRLSAYREWGMSGRLKDADIDDVLARDQVVVGDAGQCLNTLGRFSRAGASPIVLRVQWPGLPVSESKAMIASLAEAG